MRGENILAILQNHVVSSSVEYCYQLWKESPFELKLTKTRHTKVGDFTSRRSAHPRITLNHDLNNHLFLMTYIHEVAHLRVHIKYGNKVEPHGEEWKDSFRELMVPILQESSFPTEILHQLLNHMVNPKASSFADTELTKSFRKYDADYQKMVVLAEIPEGSIFRLQGRYFSKGKLRRTRILCKELKSKKNYLVPIDALVSDIQLSLL